jgi:hypothetical protein
MDAFKPVVNNRHFYKRIGAVFVSRVQVRYQAAHQVFYFCRVLRWHINGLSGGLVYQRRTRKFAQARIVLFERLLKRCIKARHAIPTGTWVYVDRLAITTGDLLMYRVNGSWHAYECFAIIIHF